MKQSKKNLIYRLTLSMLILVCFFANGYAFGMLTRFQPEDFIFSCIVVAVFTLFAGFELTLTLINIKKEPSLKKITYTERGYFNFIPFIAITLGTLIGLGLFLTGIILYFVKNEMSIRCNSLVVLIVGLYLLVNCIAYYLYILLNRKKEAHY